MHRALGGAPALPDSPLPLAGARGRWAPARQAGGWVGAAASRRVQFEYLKKSGCPLCRNQLFKIFPCAALPSLSRTMLEKRGQILPKKYKRTDFIILYVHRIFKGGFCFQVGLKTSFMHQDFLLSIFPKPRGPKPSVVSTCIPRP